MSAGGDGAWLHRQSRRAGAAPVRRLVARGFKWVRGPGLAPVRRRIIARGSGPWRLLPDRIQSGLDLYDDRVGPLRVELGGGPFPRPGYVHVDQDPSARHLEHLAPAWSLPFPDGTVKELLAIHVLEHVHPTLVGRTLREWHRALAPGGVVELHVPNTIELFRAFEAAPPERKWMFATALLGMFAEPGDWRPEELDPEVQQPDHRALYDLPLLTSVLMEAGFANVEDATATVRDRHSEAWKSYVPNVSLVVRARATKQVNG